MAGAVLHSDAFRVSGVPEQRENRSDSGVGDAEILFTSAFRSGSIEDKGRLVPQFNNRLPCIPSIL